MFMIVRQLHETKDTRISNFKLKVSNKPIHQSRHPSALMSTQDEHLPHGLGIRGNPPRYYLLRRPAYRFPQRYSQVSSDVDKSPLPTREVSFQLFVTTSLPTREVKRAAQRAKDIASMRPSTHLGKETPSRKGLMDRFGFNDDKTFHFRFLWRGKGPFTNDVR